MDAYTVVLLWTICAWTAVRLSSFLVYRRARLMHMTFYVFCYVFLGVTPLAQIAAGHFTTLLHFASSAPITDHGTISRTSTLFFVGIVAHELAYELPRWRARQTPDESIRAALDDKWILLLCYAGILVSLAAVATSGLSVFFSSREAASAALVADGSGGAGTVWYRVAHTVPFVSYFLLLHLMRSDRTKRTMAYWLPAAVLTVCNLIINNPIGNSRLWANAVLFAILSVFVDLRRPKAVAWVVVLLTAAFLLVFPYADATRRSGGVSFAINSPITEFSTSASFDAFQTGANGLRYVDLNGLTWGRQLVASLFTFIPRSIWHTKPPDTGYLIDPIYNRAATIWTEMHVNFGIAAVVVGLALLGFGARRCDDGFIARRAWASILVPMLSMYYFILLRGTLSAAVDIILPVLILVALPLRASARRTQAVQGSPSMKRTVELRLPT